MKDELRRERSSTISCSREESIFLLLYCVLLLSVGALGAALFLLKQKNVVFSLAYGIIPFNESKACTHRLGFRVRTLYKESFLLLRNNLLL